MSTLDLVKHQMKTAQDADLQATLERPPLLARYVTAAGQTIFNSSNTIVNFDTKFYDTQNCVTTGAAWKFTAPVSGYYYFTFQCMFTTRTWAAGDIIEGSVYRDGVVFAYMNRYYTHGATGYKTIGGNGLIYVATASFIDFRIYQNSGSDIALHNAGDYNWCDIHKV